MDLRAPVTHSDYIVVADAGAAWGPTLTETLKRLGFSVDCLPSVQVAQTGFEQGAAALVLAPQPGDDPDQLWLSIVERAGRQLPTLMVILPQGAPTDCARWLQSGFDDFGTASDDPAHLAARLVARVRASRLHQAMVTSDPLTGLPSPHVFFSRLDPMMRLSSRAAMPMAVAVLDMDGFVALEAQHGRPLVRALLIDIARHLQAALRRSDTVARLGDDRFGLILHHINGYEARKLLRKLWRSLVLEPATVELMGSGNFVPTFTAGISVFPDDATNGNELYTRAEIALDVARANGHRGIQLYSETSGDSGQSLGGSDLRLHRSDRGNRSEPE
jgi:diguanylate cyclase (GGDEF)-like protein